MKSTGLITFFVFWVLWSRVQLGNTQSWNYVDTYDTRKECDGGAAMWVEKQSKHPAWQRILGKSKNMLRFINEDGYETTLEYICAPDSVDPRPRS